MVYIILAMLLYSVSILMVTASSRHASTILVAGITNAVSALIPIAVILYSLNKKSIRHDKFGVMMALLAGLAIALFTIALTKSYTVNKIGVVAPIVFGGAIFLSTILSYFIFKEKVTIIEGLGLLLLGVGLSVIIFARATGR